MQNGHTSKIYMCSTSCMPDLSFFFYILQIQCFSNLCLPFHLFWRRVHRHFWFRNIDITCRLQKLLVQVIFNMLLSKHGTSCHSLSRRKGGEQNERKDTVLPKRHLKFLRNIIFICLCKFIIRQLPHCAIIFKRIQDM